MFRVGEELGVGALPSGGRSLGMFSSRRRPGAWGKGGCDRDSGERRKAHKSATAELVPKLVSPVKDMLSFTVPNSSNPSGGELVFA